MKKTKMVLAGTGGAIGLIVLVLAFLVWQAYSEKAKAFEGDDEEGADGLETVISRAETASRRPVYPCAESVREIEAKLETVEAWCRKGLKLASRGDTTLARTTPAQFKTDIVNETKTLLDLPTNATAKLLKPDFAFGPFKGYIVEGKMPSEAALSGLQRQWNDMTEIIRMLSATGVTEVVDFQVREGSEKGAGGEKDAKGAKDAKAARKGEKRKNKPSAETASLIPKSSAQTYVITFVAKPRAFVNVLNGLAASERFTVVDDFAFSHQGDSIAETLGADEKKPGAQQASGGRRGGSRKRGRKAAEEAASAKPQGEGKPAGDGIVADPKGDALLVTMTVTVHDFRSLEDDEGGEAESLPPQKGDSK